MTHRIQADIGYQHKQDINQLSSIKNGFIR